MRELTFVLSGFILAGFILLLSFAAYKLGKVIARRELVDERRKDFKLINRGAAQYPKSNLVNFKSIEEAK
jgi:hypothetical protein